MTPTRPPGPTDDEARVLRLLGTGITDDVAAERLGWTPRTLRRRLRAAMDKLGASSRFQAGMLAERAGWLEGDDDAGSGQAVMQTHKGWPWDPRESLYGEAQT